MTEEGITATLWKKYQKQNKQSKQLKLALLALGFLLLLLLLAKLFSMFSSLSQPFNSSLNSAKKYTWDGKSTVNILVYSQNSASDKTPNDSKVALVNLNPQNSSMTILHISDQIYLDLPKGYGSWKLGSIFDLGQEEKPQRGSQLLKLSVSKLVGLPIDGLIVLNNLNESGFEEVVNNWRKYPYSRLSFLRTISTDLTPIELYKFIQSSSTVRSDKITSLSFAQSNITRSQLLPDSSRVLGVDTIRLDSFIRDNISDPTISEEDITVSIFNATTHPGLAQEASRVLTNLGINVIILSNTEKILDKSIAVYKEENLKNSVTFQKSAQFFAPDCLKEVCLSDDQKALSSRAQITILLGEDYYNLWYKK